MKPKASRGSRGPIFFAILGLGLIVLIIGGVKFLQIRKMMSMKPPMPVETVSSAVVKEVDWAPILSSVGSISPVQGATSGDRTRRDGDRDWI